MNLLAISSVLFLGVASPVVAVAQPAPAPQETVTLSASHPAQACVAEYLSRYIKVTKGKFLSQWKNGPGDHWVEHDGLVIGRVTPQPVSPSQQAEGVRSVYEVSISAKSHRTYNPRTAQWSQPVAGRFFLFSSMLRVTESQSGMQVADQMFPRQFLAFSARGNPALIPSVINPLETQSTNLLHPTSPEPKPSAPATGTPESKPPMQDAVQYLVSKVYQLGAIMIVTVVIAAILMALLKSKRKRNRGPKHPGKQSPPPLHAAVPPPLCHPSTRDDRPN